MSRAPRASVPKTSGQGISRHAYQKVYASGPRTSMGEINIEDAKGPSPRKYAKEKSKREYNIDYSELLPIGSLDDVEQYAKDKPPKGLKLTPKPTPKTK